MSSLSTIPDKARRVLVSLNPRAGAKSGRPLVEQLCEQLQAEGFDCQLESDIDEVSRLAAQYLQNGELRAVVSAGGDGTAALVVNQTPPGTPICIFPLGTENLLAKHLQLRADVSSALRLIAAGQSLTMDAGKANGKLFLLMLGCGFDADVVQQVHSKRKGHISRWSYFKPILSAIRRYQYPSLRIVCETDQEGAAAATVEQQLVAKWAFVVNVPRYAGGLRFVPEASGHDGVLDLCTFKHGSLFSGLWYLSSVVFRFNKGIKDCVVTQAKRIRIESDEEVYYQLDGDPGGRLPVDIDVLPERVTLLVDPDWARRNGFDKSI